MEKYDSRQDTIDHIARVGQLLIMFATDLQTRAAKHDRSKLESPEKEIFDEMTPKLKGSTYGSDEYKEFLVAMKPALDHHYANNSHHPEHYPGGVNDMDLLDVVEMLIDWKAAGERHADGNIGNSIAINSNRFKLEPQLATILYNTARNFGWLHGETVRGTNATITKKWD